MCYIVRLCKYRTPLANQMSDSRVEDRTSTRGRILSSAERLFAEHGFNGVSMPMIAKASGITAGAIYKHFVGKADLFFEVVRRTVQSTSMPHATENTSDVMLLPQALARYSRPELKLLRQLALEVHAASVKHPKVRRLLRRAVDQQIQQIGTSIAAAQQAGKADEDVDAELLAAALMVFTMGLMHMETIAPRLVGDAVWQDFVRDRVAAMLGVSKAD